MESSALTGQATLLTAMMQQQVAALAEIQKMLAETAAKLTEATAITDPSKGTVIDLRA